MGLSIVSIRGGAALATVLNSFLWQTGDYLPADLRAQSVRRQHREENGEGMPRIRMFVGAAKGKDVSISSVPETGGDRKHPIFQAVQLRVISLTWAPPRSSYFSNFEVFIAEKWLNKKESEFIKLVYEFLPYQQRLSEYDSHDLTVLKLRVTRDATCDERQETISIGQSCHIAEVIPTDLGFRGQAPQIWRRSRPAVEDETQFS